MLKTLVESLAEGVTCLNEQKQTECGAPDLIVLRGETPLGYIEAKDIGKSLDKEEEGEQLGRYREGLGNLILTDYLEFRWYVQGEPRLQARLASVDKRTGGLRAESGGGARVGELLGEFLREQTPTIQSPEELALRMAALVRVIRNIIRRAMAGEGPAGTLRQQMAAFREVLIHDLDEEQFADMYAQTIGYGLFAARCNTRGRERFTRQHAAHALPKTNPFLRWLFQHLAGPELADEPYAWAVEQLAEVLARANIGVILRDFGRRTRREDPVVHFYETFLKAYDPSLRVERGVYYTPEPVVSYIVRSVDHILKNDFRLRGGLADTAKLKTTPAGDEEMHKVLILDPATGTGTFLYSVINHIYEAMKGEQGMWSAYVSEHLLPRLFGFELLMAPYAVAHLKLGLQLDALGYDFKADERLKVYLTNTLEEAHEVSRLPLFAQRLAEEANAASRIKQEYPVMVVLGNPPYSGHSMNVGAWIAGLLRGHDTRTGESTENYFEVDGQPLGERQPKWLNDDYVKFIRFAQWRIEQTGYGVLAFVTNHGYLDNPTFRGMRQSLMRTFDDVYVLDLHGNAKKKERAPDGGKDDNVFDIQQGVAVGLFVRRRGGDEGVAKVHHADLWGERETYAQDSRGERALSGGKYHWLSVNDVGTTGWTELEPQSPFYLFKPQDEIAGEEYLSGWALREMMPENSVGVVTARDSLTVHVSRGELLATVRDFSSLPTEEARARYELGRDARDWKVSLAQKDLLTSPISDAKIVPLLYRPFDYRFTYYTGQSRGFIGQPQQRIMRHMLAGNNLGLCTTRSTEIARGWEHVFCTSQMIQHHTVSLKEVNYLFPLYTYPAERGSLFADLRDDAAGERHPNLAPEFIGDLERRLRMRFLADGKGDRTETFGPEDVFDYMYAVFNSPTYRSRYAEFLKTDFPRLPLTSDAGLFRALCGLGAQLVALHLLEESGPDLAHFPVEGDNVVERFEYREPVPGVREGRVSINRTQYFEGVPPEAWRFHVGGYQICQRWLKDRKGRALSYADLTHYKRVVSAVVETIRLMAEVDVVIEDRGGWPLDAPG
jgi:predicted helicase